MKKIHVIFCAMFIMAMCLFVPTTKAQNDLNNVSFYWNTDQSTKTLTLQCQWTQNSNFIEVQFLWDTISGLYRFAGPIPASIHYALSGTTSFVINNYKPCTEYYLKLQFRDGTTNNIYSTERFITTPGNQIAEIKSFSFGDIGYSFVNLNFEINGHCSCYSVYIKCYEQGKQPVYESNDGYCGDAQINKLIYGLEPYKNYIVEIKVTNQFGESIRGYGVSTLSNLSPVIEPNNVMTGIDNNGAYANFNCFVDPKGNESEWRIEYGEDLGLLNNSSWMLIYNKCSVGITLGGLKSATMYYWRPVVRNDFGQGEGRIMSFKTFGLTGIEDNTEKKFAIYPNPTTGVIHMTEDLSFDISDVTGKIICHNNSGTYYDLSNNPAGIYLFRNQHGTFQIMKK